MKILQAGPVTAGYENGFLRRVSYGETEVLRMIYFALRDHNWNTLNSRIESENISMSDDGFEITYDCYHLDGGATVMEWKGKVSGRSDGSIIFEIRGAATENFKKNRAGFCVLHPLNIAGEDCKIIHPDQTEIIGRFPIDVAPENPFKNIQSMEWQCNGVPFALSFEGDIFETEDQRNWGDASYKTFCTPLDIPFPVELKRGQKVFQRITFKPRAKLQPAKSILPYVSLRESKTRTVLPLLGIAASTEITGVPERAVSLLRDLNLSHYRIDVYPGNENWVSSFSNDYETGFSLGLPLEVVLHLTGKFQEETESFAQICQQNRVKLKKVLLLQRNGMVTNQNMINHISSLRGVFPNVLFGAGTNYNFNEINKNHFAPATLDYISFSIDPQEHAIDDLTILENIETQEQLVKSAKSIYGHAMSVHISPVTLRKRFNPYATNPDDLFIEESIKADPRQKEQFAAVWTFGCLCSLSRGGAAAITLYQTIGNQGIMSGDAGPYPVYHVIKRFSEYQGKAVNVLESSDPLSVLGILVDGKVMGLANLTEVRKTVRLQSMEFILEPREIKFEALNRS